MRGADTRLAEAWAAMGGWLSTIAEGLAAMRGWPRVIGVGLVLALTAGPAGCAHTAMPGPDGATLYGSVRVRVVNDAGKVEIERRQGVMVSVWGELPGQKREEFLQLTTQRSGWFYKAGLKPGRYRITVVRAPAWTEGRAVPEGDLAFAVTESGLGVGSGGMRTAAVEQVGELEATFELGPGEVRYLGHLELTFGPMPKEARPGCVAREVLLPGAGGEVWASSGAVGGELCRELRPEEARVFLEGMRK